MIWSMATIMHANLFWMPMHLRKSSTVLLDLNQNGSMKVLLKLGVKDGVMKGVGESLVLTLIIKNILMPEEHLRTSFPLKNRNFIQTN